MTEGRRRRRRKIVLGLVARSLLSIALPPVGLDRVHRSGGLPEFGEQIHKSKSTMAFVWPLQRKSHLTMCADVIEISILPNLTIIFMAQESYNTDSRLDFD